MPRTWLALLFFASFLQAEAQTADTLKTANIRNVDVVAPRLRGKLRANALGQITLNLDFLNDMPKLFGNADPLRYAQSLPNVQTSGELDAGLHIEGCDNAHNEMSLNGVPVHNAFRCSTPAIMHRCAFRLQPFRQVMPIGWEAL